MTDGCGAPAQTASLPATVNLANEAVIQGTVVRGGDVVPGARMILTVHDELVFEVPEGHVDEAKAKVKEAMESAFPLDVPLEVDVGDGAHWGEAH